MLADTGIHIWVVIRSTVPYPIKILKNRKFLETFGKAKLVRGWKVVNEIFIFTYISFQGIPSLKLWKILIQTMALEIAAVARIEMPQLVAVLVAGKYNLVYYNNFSEFFISLVHLDYLFICLFFQHYVVGVGQYFFCFF